MYGNQISPGTSSHTTIKMPGKGIIGMNGRHGTHIFHIKINIPKYVCDNYPTNIIVLLVVGI